MTKNKYRGWVEYGPIAADKIELGYIFAVDHAQAKRIAFSKAKKIFKDVIHHNVYVVKIHE